MPDQLKAARVTNATQAKDQLPAAFSALETALAFLLGLNLDTLYQASVLGWKLIDIKSASNSPTIDFTAGITNEHNEYVVTLNNIVPAVDGASLYCRVSQSGVFNAGAGSYQWVRVGGAAGDVSPGIASDSSDAQLIIAASVGGAVGENLSGEMRFFNPASTTKAMMAAWDLAYLLASGLVARTSGSGSPSGIAGGAFDGFRFLMSSGNITSGEFALYGLRRQ